MSGLDIERSGPIRTLTIDRPEVLNALNFEVLAGIGQAVADAAADPEIRAVVLTGSGQKAFSAGADLDELAAMGPDRAHAVMRAGQEIVRGIESAPVPVIAAVNGLALGGGFELILAATFPVLSTGAAVGLPESGLGLIPGYGGTQRLPRAVGQRIATHMMLTGTRLDAARAYDLGLTPIPPVAPEDLMSTAAAVAAKIAVQGPLAVRSILHAVDTGRDAPLDAGLRMETGAAGLAIAGDESAEGIRAFFEHRAPRFADPEVIR